VSEEQEKTPGGAVAPPAESAKPKKKKARAEGEALESIRDRNQRIRDEAAEKRRTRREGARRPTAPAGLDASEMMDDALARTTHVAVGWLKRHFNVIQWVVVAAAVGGIGWQVYAHQKQKNQGAASEALMAGVTAENGRVGTEDDGAPDPRTLLADTRPHFATDADRLAAAASAYKAVDKGENAKLLARLGLAGIYFDQGKNKEALAEYKAVRESPLATQDSDVRARSIEGIGLAEEALGNTEGALKAFRELGNFDNASLSGLGLYHQARLAFEKGDRQQAQDLLKKVLEKVAPKPDASKGLFGEAPGYIEQAAKSLLATIDPNAVQAAPRGLSPEQIQQLTSGEGAPDQEKLKELLRQISQNAPAQAPSGAPAPSPSGAPAPAPAGSP
jgi:tetratricopeptide (TPR) repeat protein